MHHVYNAIDWLSVTLNIPALYILFADVSMILKALAAAATLSTLLYNGIRIYKEIREKRNKK